ncbi:MAG: NAD(P)-dependent oxidoreductase [Chloroflexota bacterium]|nr:NAD(P)-dependent oxidoreductase [Chloroflexota bacterium]
MKVGFIGLGQMGSRMARNLARAGHELTIYDLRPESVAALAAMPGVRGASSLAETVRGNEVVFTSLPTPSDVEQVVLGPDGVRDSAAAGTILVDLSTNAPSMVHHLASALRERNIAMLDAPVSGGVEGAEAGTLSIMVGGDARVFEAVKPVLSAIGTKLFHCGDTGSGSVVKLCNNLAGQALAIITAEVLTLGVKAGVDLKILAEVIGASTGANSRLTRTFPRRVFPRRFEDPGFSAHLSAKDTRLALDLAHELGVPMPIGEVVGTDMDEVIRRGWGGLDFDVVARIQEERAGVVLQLAEAEPAVPA